MTGIEWGERSVAMEAPVEIAIGTLRASIERTAMEWIVQYRYDQDRYVRESDDAVTRLRYVLESTNGTLEISPATADRNVVARPADPIRIPRHERVTLHVSSPLWVRARIPEQSLVLADLPAQIMSDSWFGPNTRQGELCYSNETQARLSLDNLPRRPERVITPVTIINAGEDTLTVDRINLPLPLLSIYPGPESLWTQELLITREQALATAEVKLEPRPPSHIHEVSAVAQPRLYANQGSVTRALELLFR